MGRTPGSGRKPGTLNKKTLSLQEKCDKAGVDPWEKLLEFLIYPCEPGLRLAAIKEMCKYLYPQRKAIEHTVTPGGQRQLQGKSDEALDAIIVEQDDSDE